MDVSPSLLRGALGISVILNIILITAGLWPDGEPVAAPAAVAEVAPVDEPAVAAEVEAPATENAEEPADTRVTVAALKNSIPQTLATAAEPYGKEVSATLSRVLVWDLDLRRDLRADDKIEAMWSMGSSDKVIIRAARFHTQKHNRTIEAYRFQAAGDKYPSYWSADGVEVPHRLKNSPLAEYEQITSLLKDRPTHHGMDFKVAVGTPVRATFDGVVTRANWNWNANGNCVEVKAADGTLAKFLHLSENKVEAGARVKTGQTIALSGNTGRSTGPHLHYQLNKGKKVIDPIDFHGTDRRKLPDGDRASFDEVVTSSRATLDAAGPVAAK